MSDIEIVFGTNAPTVTREIADAEKATTAAAKATVALDKAVAAVTAHIGNEAKGLKQAAAAAREYAKELRASQNLLTGAPGSSRGAATPFGDMGRNGAIRTNIQRALAQSNRDIRTAMEKAGEEGGGSFGSGIRRALERSLNRKGFLGSTDSWISKGLQNAGVGPGASAGVAATVGIGAAYLAVAETIKAINAGFEKHLATLTRVSEAAGQYRDNLREAAELNRAAGVQAAQEHGNTIVKTAALGGQAGLDMVRDFARRAGTSENDAGAAYSTLFTRFKGDQAAIRKGLGIGSDVVRAGGFTSLNAAVGTLGRKQLDNPDAARDRLEAFGLGQWRVKQGGYAAAAANVAATPDAKSVLSIRGSLAGADVNGDRQLAAGTVGAMDIAARAADPGGRMLLDRFNEQERRLQVMRDINDAMGPLTKLWDGVVNGSSSIRVRLANAEQSHAIEGGFGTDANGAHAVQ